MDDDGDIGLSGGALSMDDAADVVVAFFLFLVIFVLPIPCFLLSGGCRGMVLFVAFPIAGIISFLIIHYIQLTLQST